MSEQISRRKPVMGAGAGALVAASGGARSALTRVKSVLVPASAKIWEFYNNFKGPAGWQDNNPANGDVDATEFLSFLQNYPQTNKVPLTAVADASPWDIPQLRFLQAVAAWEGLFKARLPGDPATRPLTVIEKPLLACAIWPQSSLSLGALQAGAALVPAAPNDAKIWEAYAKFKTNWVDVDNDQIVDEPELASCIDNYQPAGADPPCAVTEPPPWDVVQFRFLRAILAWEGLLAPRVQDDPDPRPLAPTEKRVLKCAITSLPDALIKKLLALIILNGP